MGSLIKDSFALSGAQTGGWSDQGKQGELVPGAQLFLKWKTGCIQPKRKESVKLSPGTSRGEAVGGRQ